MHVENFREVPEALKAWYGHDEPLFLSAVDGHSVRGELPLKRVYDRIFGFQTARLELVSPHHARADPEAARALVDYLVHHERFGLLELGGDVFARAANAVHGVRVRAQCLPGPARAAVPLSSDLDTWFSSLDTWGPPLHRRVRSLMAAGELELVSSDDPCAGRELFNLYVELEARSSKLEAATGVSSDPHRAACCATLAEDGTAGFHFLLLDGLPIAGSISIGAGDRRVQLETVCDMGFEASAPDEVLFILEVRDAINRRATALELSPDMVARATRLGAIVAETWRVQVYRRFGLHHLDRLLRGIIGVEVATAAHHGQLRNNLSRQLRARTHTAEALDRLESAGARVSRLWGDVLLAALPFAMQSPPSGRVRRAV